MRGFDRGPYKLSGRSKNVRSDLYIPPNVRMEISGTVRIYFVPGAGGQAGSNQVNRNHGDAVMWWRRKQIRIQNQAELVATLGTGSQSLRIQTTDKLLLVNGGESSSGMAVSTLYYIYMNPDGIMKASVTSYMNSWDGVRVLADTAGGRDWLFIGWVRTDGSTLFSDSTTDRLVVNYYNRIRKGMTAKPGYSDVNTDTTYTQLAGNWARANAGTGSRVSFISNGEDTTLAVGHMSASSGAGGHVRVGVGLDTTTDCLVGAVHNSVSVVPGSASYEQIVAEGYHTLDLMIGAGTATGTFYADQARNGAVADVPMTFLNVEVSA